MISPDKFSFQRYLRAKKSIDDRSINYRVWKCMEETLSSKFINEPPNILEVGAGIGTMLERIIEWNLIDHANYLGIDSDVDNISFASGYLNQISRDLSYQQSIENGKILLHKPSQIFEIDFKLGEIMEFASYSSNKNRCDLLIANAILDLLNLERALPLLFSLIKPKCYFYFSINFDGLSILEPIIDDELDKKILDLYHLSMDNRIIDTEFSAGSRTGRKLFNALTAAGGGIIETGSSDWVVYPKEGVYPRDEAYFLHHILHFFESTLTGHPDLNPNQFKSWIATRRKQVDEGKLIYIAHQLGFFGLTKDNASIS